MFKGRRAGTLTTGILLIVFGLLFLARLIFPELDLAFILSLWPLVLVFLGIEIIVSYAVNSEEKIKYDAGAIALIIILSLFTIGMAGAEFILDHSLEINNCVFSGRF